MIGIGQIPGAMPIAPSSPLITPPTVNSGLPVGYNPISGNTTGSTVAPQNPGLDVANLPLSPGTAWVTGPDGTEYQVDLSTGDMTTAVATTQCPSGQTCSFFANVPDFIVYTVGIVGALFLFIAANGAGK
jgi:hypothetical protein